MDVNNLVDEQQLQQQPMPMFQPQVPAEILALELDFQKFLDGFEHKLKGMVQRLEGKQQVWKKIDDPWMNDDGVSKIISIIGGHIDVNTFLTQLMDTDINIIAWNIADEVAMIISNKCVEFDIDPSYLGIIHSIIVNTIFFALKRAQGALTLKQIHSITQRTENPMALEQMRQKERKGFLGRFF